MITILSDYLDGYTTPEMKSVVAEAFRLFDLFGEEEYETGFEQLVMTSGQYDQNDTTDAILILVAKLQVQLMAQHGIQLTDEATMIERNKILAGLQNIENYDVPADIVKAAFVISSPEEAFGEVMHLVTDMTVDHMLTIIDSVTPALIAKIRELANKAEEGIVGEEDPALHARHIRLIEILFTHESSAKSVFYDMMKRGMSVGFPFSLYMSLVGPSLAAEDITPRAIAVEFIAMAYASSDAVDKPRDVMKQYVDKYVHDITKITRATLELNTILQELNVHEEI